MGIMVSSLLITGNAGPYIINRIHSVQSLKVKGLGVFSLALSSPLSILLLLSFAFQDCDEIIAGSTKP